jgi:shikimate dehydrogenase
LGNPIAHSLSPFIHTSFAKQMGIDLRYDKIHVELAQFEQTVIDFFDQGGVGLNVTLPFKERAFLMSDEQSPRSAAARAANTLWMKQGRLCADNTDGEALVCDLKRYTVLDGESILLLGAGGAARGVVGPLLDSNPCILTVANRTISRAQSLQHDFPQVACLGFEDIAQDALLHDYNIVINATAVRLDESFPILPEVLFSTKPFCYDLSYGELQRTYFVKLAEQHDCASSDGLGMLVEQAALAFYIWHGIKPVTLPVLEMLRQKKR